MSTVHSIPKIELRIDGLSVSRLVLDALVEITVNERLSLPTQAEVMFCFLSATEMPRLATSGARIAILVESATLFEGDVTAVEYEFAPPGGRVLRIRAYDRLHRLRKRQSVCTHHKQSFTELAKVLANEAQLMVTAHVSGGSGKTRLQYRQTDFELLAEVADTCGQFFVVRENTLHLLTLEGFGTENKLNLGENLFEVRFELNSDASCKRVETTGWDPATMSIRRGSAGKARSGRQVKIKTTASQAFGSDCRTTVGHILADDTEARILAQSLLDRRAATDVTVGGVADGDPNIHAGGRVRIEGAEPDVDGRYVVTSVSHTVDNEKGYVTEFSSAPPPLHRPSRSSTAATWGVVISISDPEKLGRVRVHLPAYDKIETDWIGVIAPGGSSTKGLVAMPDVGDDVLIILLHDDPGHAVVVGGLCNKKGPPDSGGIEAGAVRRFSFLTPGGQSVRLNDTDHSVHVQNSSGSFVQLAPGKTTIHAKSDLTIEAPGKTVSIRGGAIRFEEA